jgi:hypothetical protein
VAKLGSDHEFAATTHACFRQWMKLGSHTRLRRLKHTRSPPKFPLCTLNYISHIENEEKPHKNVANFFANEQPNTGCV